MQTVWTHAAGRFSMSSLVKSISLSIIKRCSMVSALVDLMKTGDVVFSVELVKYIRRALILELIRDLRLGDAAAEGRRDVSTGLALGRVGQTLDS